MAPQFPSWSVDTHGPLSSSELACPMIRRRSDSSTYSGSHHGQCRRRVSQASERVTPLPPVLYQDAEEHVARLDVYPGCPQARSPDSFLHQPKPAHVPSVHVVDQSNMCTRQSELALTPPDSAHLRVETRICLLVTKCSPDSVTTTRQTDTPLVRWTRLKRRTMAP